MEKRARLRVQKKPIIKRSNDRKLWLKKFLDYLKSDTYMYAPVLSPQPSVFATPNAFKGLSFTPPHQFFIFLFPSLLFFDGVVVL